MFIIKGINKTIIATAKISFKTLLPKIVQMTMSADSFFTHLYKKVKPTSYKMKNRIAKDIHMLKLHFYELQHSLKE